MSIKASLKRKRPVDTDPSVPNQVQMKKNFLFGTNVIGDSSNTMNAENGQRKPASVSHQIASVFKNKIEFFNSSSSSSVSSTPASLAKPILKQPQPQTVASVNGPLTLCYVCNEKVFLMERQTVLDCTMHATCFRCSYCSRILRNGYYNYSKDPLQPNSKCTLSFTNSHASS